jgi:hypothetical protein
MGGELICAAYHTDDLFVIERFGQSALFVWRKFEISLDNNKKIVGDRGTNNLICIKLLFDLSFVQIDIYKPKC